MPLVKIENGDFGTEAVSSALVNSVASSERGIAQKEMINAGLTLLEADTQTTYTPQEITSEKSKNFTSITNYQTKITQATALHTDLENYDHTTATPVPENEIVRVNLSADKKAHQTSLNALETDINGSNGLNKRIEENQIVVDGLSNDAGFDINDGSTKSALVIEKQAEIQEDTDKKVSIAKVYGAVRTSAGL